MDDREYEDLTVESQTEEVEAAEPTESQPKKYGLTIAEFGKPQKPREGSIFSLLFEGLDVVVTAMIAVIIIFIFVFKVPTIDGNSMNDTLFHGERVVISSLFYEPQYGDIVVISRNYYNKTAVS